MARADRRRDRVHARVKGTAQTGMTDTSEFHSVWPVVNARFDRATISSLSDNKENSVEESGEGGKEDDDYDEDGDESSEVKLPPDAIAFNTNARHHQSRDRLRQLFNERHSHKSLSEQKVSDWLLRYRSYFHCSPKDLSDIPDAIWAPLDIGPSTKNTTDSDVIDLQGHNVSSGAMALRRRKNQKFHSPENFDQTAPVASEIKPEEDAKRRYHSIATDIRQIPKPLTLRFQVPYFFQPPYKLSSKSLKRTKHIRKLDPLRKSENYLDLSKGLLRASKMPK